MSLTSIRLNKEFEKPLEQLAKKQDRSKSYLINEAVKEYIARQAAEDERWEETLAALDSVKRGDAIDEESVNSWLDSWGTESIKQAPTK